MEKELPDQILDIAREFFLDHGEISPILFLKKGDKISGVIAFNQLSPERKYELMYSIGQRVRQEKVEVEEVYFIHEGWMKKGEPPSLPIRDLPDKEECLVVTWGRKGKYKSRALIIERTKDGPVFTPIEEPDKVESPLLDKFWEGLER